MPASAAGAEGEEKAAEAWGREVLYCDTVHFDIMGRKVKGGHEGRGNLVFPTRLRPLVGVDIRFVASGCAACHCVAVSSDGRCFSWGRNEKGQLGHGDTLVRNLPTVVSELSKYNIIAVGVGRKHTVVVTDEGKSFAFGDNKHGQLGTGSLKKGTVVSPVPCLVTEVTSAVCGADFTVWLSSVDSSSILTAGLPQYGQLGHGSNNEYNAKVSSVSLVYDPQPHPRAVAALSGNTIVKVACGTNHTVAVDSSGFVYTWGFGGYGRLGHNEQKDEWQPRLVEIFQKNNIVGPNDIISAGSVNSACTAGEYFCSVGCGVGMSLIVVDRANVGGKLDQLDTFDGDADAIFQENTKELYFPACCKHPAVDETEEETPPEAKQATNSRSNKRRKALERAEPEDEDETEEVSEEEAECGSHGRGQSTRRGRGRGSKMATPEPMPSGRGRGRPKKGSPGAAPAEAGGKKSGKRGRPRK